jgi:hypothetical protein
MLNQHKIGELTSLIFKEMVYFVLFLWYIHWVHISKDLKPCFVTILLTLKKKLGKIITICNYITFDIKKHLVVLDKLHKTLVASVNVMYAMNIHYHKN